MSGRCGGLGETRKVDEEVKKLCEELKGEVEKYTGMKFTKYQPLTYRSQVVEGANYFVKIVVDEGCIHVKIFQPLPYTGQKPSVTACQSGKTVDDPIEPF